MAEILFIEDQPADYDLVVHHMRRHGLHANMLRVHTLERLEELLAQCSWDAILTDYNVPGMPFSHTLEMLRERMPDCPIVLVSGSIGEQAAVELLRQGVWDFVLKDNLIRLCPALERAFGEVALRRARKKGDERLRQAAAVFDSTQEGVVIADLDAHILAVNKAFSDITGYAEEEVLGCKPGIQRSGRHGPEFYQSLWTSLLSVGQWQGEIWNRRKSGELYPAWMTISTVYNEKRQSTHYVSVFSDITQLKHSEEQLAHLAHYDPLTQLPNRLLLQSRLEHAIARAERHGGRAGLLFIDLDRFKTINDSLGHVAGDHVLVEAARRLRERVRDEDTLSRFGGDEFVLLIEPIAGPDEAAIVARDLLGMFEAPFHPVGGNEAYIGASIGISIYPDDGLTSVQLLRDAEAAMYQAKDTGRNRFCFYTADMTANAVAQLELENALRRAIERKEFILHYQPKVNLRGGRIYGAEALLRWQREGTELEYPARFIPLAEKTGLIVPIGAWVVDAACRQLRAWREAGITDLQVSINVSAQQFYSGDLVTVVEQALARHGVPAAQLELEVTESMLMVDPERTVNILHALRKIGVQLSLDDFGTGYSSFAYLSRFPINTLKIDQTFVRDIVTEPQAAMIAVSIIDLAHRMRLKVVAEGVETEQQLHYLRHRNCDQIQGYYFAKPMPPEDFEQLVREGRALPARLLEDATGERTVLVVDDEPNVLATLKRLLTREGFRVITAASGMEGLEKLASHPAQVILADQRMPHMTGTDFLRRAKDLHPDTVRIVLSGYADLASVTSAVNEGAIFKFLYKPWDDDLLCEHIRNAFLYHDAVVRPRTARLRE